MSAADLPLIDARGIHAYYGSSHVLRGLDFSVRAGEAVALMGRHGMGKTTLLKSLVGLVRPREGALSVRGRDMTRAEPHAIARAGLAYVSKGRGIFPNLSVWENLMMAARPGVRGRRDWTLGRVLDSFPRLAARLEQGGAQLQDGEQQMLAIGRALMTNPELLILDELTEGLAPDAAQEIWGIVAALKEAGMAMIVVDKDFAAVSRIADRAVILAEGVAVFSGTTAQLRAQPELRDRHLAA